MLNIPSMRWGVANVHSPCQVLITNNNPIDTIGKEPDERFDTALKALEVLPRSFSCCTY